MVQFWNPAYSCFTFGNVDLVPTLEEYTALLRCPRIQGHKAYVRPARPSNFYEEIDVKKRVDVLALSIYGMVIFPKALRHIDEAVADLFDQLGKQNTLMPAILAETIRSLSACRRAGEGRFIGCAQLLLNLREEDVMWKASWLVPSEVLYRCGSFDWVLLPGIWGVVGYTPLLVLRQYRARQFIPATQGLAQSDFSYKEDHYKKRMREIAEAWKKPFCMMILTEGSTSTLEYKGWLLGESMIMSLGQFWGWLDH
ncbi:hypothetical protein CXB51_009560 [Gossypium anomalum]|uniref:DUF7745 domain-containing protein n=1 Tax=Gossypium anomalum TaxID=47600 RepID=A0A8J5Z7U4_9ROSI|nr:hypothetical protein CXB51_009560 [Gossypium anomalum]